jgi:hypothetical protein
MAKSGALLYVSRQYRAIPLEACISRKRGNVIQHIWGDFHRISLNQVS